MPQDERYTSSMHLKTLSFQVVAELHYASGVKVGRFEALQKESWKLELFDELELTEEVAA